MVFWPIEAKFHVELLWVKGTKVSSNDPGEVTTMAAMPVCGKNHIKFFPKPAGRLALHLIYSIGDWGSTKFVQMRILG